MINYREEYDSNGVPELADPELRSYSRGDYASTAAKIDAEFRLMRSIPCGPREHDFCDGGSPPSSCPNHRERRELDESDLDEDGELL